MESRTLRYILRVFLLACIFINCAFAVELTFELLDNSKDCFYERIDKDTPCILEFQVVTGGSYDVDATIKTPDNQVIYREVKSQYGSHKFVAQVTGEYSICFSNEFSTFSHKLVFMDFQVGEEQPLPGEDKPSVMTQLEDSSAKIHESLSDIKDYQTHHRLREATGQKRAEDLNERVFYWSFIETLSILIIALAQVLILKNFFSDKNSYKSGKIPM